MKFLTHLDNFKDGKRAEKAVIIIKSSCFQMFTEKFIRDNTRDLDVKRSIVNKILMKHKYHPLKRSYMKMQKEDYIIATGS